MQKQCTYRIEIQGQLEEQNFNTMSPHNITNVRSGLDATFFSIYADQSGLIGLVRHLHQQGFVILSIHREGRAKLSGESNDR